MDMGMTDREDKIQVWPEMVLRETLAAVVATILLLMVSMYFDAPLEAIADPSTSTNPSKAPWYFLGLQELLVYFSPWIAGVLIPTLIILGLAAIPYLDIRAREDGSGPVHTLGVIITVLFTGGLLLWGLLTVTGIYLRGPNWRLQWFDGTPLGTNATVMPIDWLGPAVAAVYLLTLVARPGRLRQQIKNTSPVRFILTHTLALGGSIVMLTIALYTFLNL